MSRSSVFFRLVTFLFCLSLGWWFWKGIAALEHPGHLTGPAAHYIARTAEDTGASNLVGAILFDYRALDTLGEATVIYTAVCGIAMLFSRSKYRKSSTGLSFIVKRGLGFVIPFILLYAAGIVLMGHLTPGGGFQGGAVFATMTILFCIVYGSNFEAARINPKVKEFIESSGAVMFTLIGLVGLIAGAGFLANSAAGFPTGKVGSVLSGGTIPLLNIAVGMKVGAGLSAIFYSMIKLLEVKSEKPPEGDGR
ncbi:MAG: hydrogen gas-evolving membrane-bound hydrogenase subunit E [Thermovirgaceae bacterium]